MNFTVISVENIAFTSCILILCALNFFKDRYFLFFIGFLLPIWFPALEVGIEIIWFKIIGPLSLVLYFLNPVRKKNSSPVLKMNYLILYGVIISGIWMFFEYRVLHRYEMAMNYMQLGEGQSIYKMPVQLLSFISLFLVAFIVPMRARSA